MEGRAVTIDKIGTTLGDPKILASEIGPNNDKQLVNVVIQAYFALRNTSIVNNTWHEDKITRELYVQIQIYVIKNGINTIPIHQYPIFLKKSKRGRPPTIDFVFRKGFIETSYLGFECKIINSNNSNSIQEYIDEGMYRFIGSKYSPHEKVGGMIGYTFNNDVSTCVNEINIKIDKHKILNKMDCLLALNLIKGFKNLYISKHKKGNLSESFLIYHIFMFF